MSSELVKDVIGSDSMARVRKQKFTLDVPTLQTTLDTCYRVVPMTPGDDVSERRCGIRRRVKVSWLTS